MREEAGTRKRLPAGKEGRESECRKCGCCRSFTDHIACMNGLMVLRGATPTASARSATCTKPRTNPTHGTTSAAASARHVRPLELTTPCPTAKPWLERSKPSAGLGPNGGYCCCTQ